ncbi:MAG TPA: selenocysteine-specific translation elongation factor [bacterium]
MPHIILGTAGHIDHGKTALVKAITGVDTDRLKEEKERGLTIDLGFAHLDERATIIDVPGHEKFVRNMVAGVSTIDLVLFVIAADDGIMPQTREHLDILKILQVQRGIIVITKADLVDGDWLNLIKEDIRKFVSGSFLENAALVAVSSTTGVGVAELRVVMEQQFAELRPKPDKGIFWMPIDRAFTMKGFGTVVTGSVLSGRAKVGDNLELLPPKLLVKIRGLQSQGKSVGQVTTGARAAINLQGIERDAIARGHVLAEPNYAHPSLRLDASLQLLKSAPRPLKSRTRLRLHFGTNEVMARVSLIGGSQIMPGNGGYARFYLEKPAVVRRLDAYVIRQYSPTTTIGGGVILDANPEPRQIADAHLLEMLLELEKENPLEALEGTLRSQSTLITVEQVSSDLGMAREAVNQLLEEMEQNGKVILLKKSGHTAVVHTDVCHRLQREIQSALAALHEKTPTKLGFQKAVITKGLQTAFAAELLDYGLDNLINHGVLKENSGLISLSEHRVQLSPQLDELRQKIERLLLDEAFATSSAAELAEKLSAKAAAISEVLDFMIAVEQIIHVEGDIYFHTNRVGEARERLITFFKNNEELSVSQFKDILGGTSRKYAMPLLNYFDGLEITERVGDVRIRGNGFENVVESL